jgi:glycosyltransferase involved in cell wall biosynthesis
VLLGGTFDVDVSRLRGLPNVQLLGQQPYETMPQYLFHFDACIIPFKINPITEATDPVKLYEYLSGGKPVISVKLPELAPYRDYVYLADDAAEFAAKLDQALAGERSADSVYDVNLWRSNIPGRNVTNRSSANLRKWFRKLASSL